MGCSNCNRIYKKLGQRPPPHKGNIVSCPEIDGGKYKERPAKPIPEENLWDFMNLNMKLEEEKRQHKLKETALNHVKQELLETQREKQNLQLQVQKYQPETCPICLETIDAVTGCMTTPCGHNYCMFCFATLVCDKVSRIQPKDYNRIPELKCSLCRKALMSFM